MLKLLSHFGRFILLIGNAFAKPEKWSMYWKETVRQMYDIGVGSLVIIGLISVFIGAVTAIQFSYQLDGTLIPRYYIGYIVRDIAIIELAPTFTCLVLAGKVGSNMAAELGGMRQKEHIDAMEIMGVNTAGFLIMPRLVASITVIPMLVIVAGFLAVAGGYLTMVPTHLLASEEYIQGLRSFFVPFNVTLMLVKSFVFSIILTCVSTYHGYTVSGGSIELGRASTQAVVLSDILIILADYVIAVVLTT